MFIIQALCKASPISISALMSKRMGFFSIKMTVSCELNISIFYGQVYPDTYSLYPDTFRDQHQSNVWPWCKTLEMLQNAFYSDGETIIPPASTVL